MQGAVGQPDPLELPAGQGRNRRRTNQPAEAAFARGGSCDATTATTTAAATTAAPPAAATLAHPVHHTWPGGSTARLLAPTSGPPLAQSVMRIRILDFATMQIGAK